MHCRSMDIVHRDFDPVQHHANTLMVILHLQIHASLVAAVPTLTAPSPVTALQGPLDTGVSTPPFVTLNPALSTSCVSPR